MVGAPAQARIPRRAVDRAGRERPGSELVGRVIRGVAPRGSVRDGIVIHSRRQTPATPSQREAPQLSVYQIAIRPDDELGDAVRAQPSGRVRVEAAAASSVMYACPSCCERHVGADVSRRRGRTTWSCRPGRSAGRGRLGRTPLRRRRRVDGRRRHVPPSRSCAPLSWQPISTAPSVSGCEAMYPASLTAIPWRVSRTCPRSRGPRRRGRAPPSVATKTGGAGGPATQRIRCTSACTSSPTQRGVEDVPAA